MSLGYDFSMNSIDFMTNTNKPTIPMFTPAQNLKSTITTKSNCHFPITNFILSF